MPTTQFLTAWVSIAPIAAAVAVEGAGDHVEIFQRQDGLVAPGTASDCTFFESVHESTQNCEHWETLWSISHTDFVDWVSCFVS